MADRVGIAVVSASDWGACPVCHVADPPGSRLLALHDDGPRRPKESTSRFPGAGGVASPEHLAASPDEQSVAVRVLATARASLEPGGTPVRLAPAGQEAS